jgi:hypothetical protein
MRVLLLRLVASQALWIMLPGPPIARDGSVIGR